MANLTTNYNLKKPLGTENYDIEDQNSNMDAIDAAIHAVAQDVPTKTSQLSNDTGRLKIILCKIV